jgi:hypothetical protein
MSLRLPVMRLCPLVSPSAAHAPEEYRDVASPRRRRQREARTTIRYMPETLGQAFPTVFQAVTGSTATGDRASFGTAAGEQGRR